MIDAAIEEIRDRRRQLWRGRYAGSPSRFVHDAQDCQKAHSAHVVNLRKGLNADYRSACATGDGK
jgi:hypothetical protein